jgi:hypothetical protein
MGIYLSNNQTNLLIPSLRRARNDIDAAIVRERVVSSHDRQATAFSPESCLEQIYVQPSLRSMYLLVPSKVSPHFDLHRLLYSSSIRGFKHYEKLHCHSFVGARA